MFLSHFLIPILVSVVADNFLLINKIIYIADAYHKGALEQETLLRFYNNKINGSIA